MTTNSFPAINRLLRRGSVSLVFALAALSLLAGSAQALVEHHYGGTLLQPGKTAEYNYGFPDTHLSGNIATYEGSGEVKVCEIVTSAQLGTQKSCGVNGAGNALNTQSWLGTEMRAKIENASGSAHTIQGYAYDNLEYLFDGEPLYQGQELLATNGKFRLAMQTDGNLVVYNNQTGAVCFNTNTQGHAYDYAMMQTDGNFVMDEGLMSIWAANTSGHPGAYLRMQSDGNLVVYSGTTAIWATSWLTGRVGC